MQKTNFDYTNYLDQLVPLLLAVEKLVVSDGQVSPAALHKLVTKYPKDKSDCFAKDELVVAYRHLAGQRGLKEFNPQIVRQLQMKPVRSQSGITPITVLTKPFPCPGKCIFCPNDIRMPKSYLANEPGAQRAERNYFDPYLQTYNRLQAFENIGHEVDKCELIILGGTWSFYPEAYQIWFIEECFRALNDFSSGINQSATIEDRYTRLSGQSNDPHLNEAKTQSQQIDGQRISKSYNEIISELYVAPEIKMGFDRLQKADWSDLEKQQKLNETARCRNVGLVIETRPDNISETEVRRIRRLGCTKTQIGVQSLDDEVLRKNHRGHDVAATRLAFALLRQAGFKIHAHWMPNLYGSSPNQDKQDYELLFSDPDFKPDELKIYPCSLIANAELMQYYQDGRWQPYTEAELLDVLTFCLTHTPEYCRLTRVIRDIPSTDIVTGNKKTNFREIAAKEIIRTDLQSHDIRAREIKLQKLKRQDLVLDITSYPTSVSTEYFLQFITPQDRKIAGFLRLSLPLPTVKNFITELQNAAIIREIHVYGQVVALGSHQTGRAQHLGLGTELIAAAVDIALQNKFNKLAVISAIGTREYYRQRGFQDGELYQVRSLTKEL